ncbi:hypothetical protein Vretifemale_671, partial [Volvox reticuliferus]
QATQLRVALEECQRRLRRAASETTALRNEVQMRRAELNNTRRAMEEREAKLAALRATLLVCELPGKELGGGGGRGGNGGGGGSTAAAGGGPPPAAVSAAMAAAAAPSVPPGVRRAASAPAAAAPSGGAPVINSPPQQPSPDLNGTVTAGKEDEVGDMKRCRSDGPVAAVGTNIGGGGRDCNAAGSGSDGGSCGARRRMAIVRPPTEFYRRPGGFAARGVSSGTAAAAAGGASLMTTVAAAAAAAGKRKGRYDGMGTEEEVTPKLSRRGPSPYQQPQPQLRQQRRQRAMTDSVSDRRRLGASLVSELFNRLDRLERLHSRSAAALPQQPRLRSRAGQRRRLLLSRGYVCSSRMSRPPLLQQQQQVQLLDVKAKFSSAGCGLELVAPSAEKVDAAVSYPPQGEASDTAGKMPTAAMAMLGPNAGCGAPASGVAAYPPMTAQLSIILRKL